MKLTSSLNKKAWAIRKEAAAKLGCGVTEISWKHCLLIVNGESIETLKYIGNEGSDSDRHRIYFENIPELYGLACEFDKKGHINAARLDGEPIRRNKARKILRDLSDIKFWYDVKTRKYIARGRCHYNPIDHYAEKLANAVKDYKGKLRLD